MAEKEEGLLLEGVVMESLRGGKFLIKVPHGESEIMVTGYLGGKLRSNNIRVVPGDRVKIEVSVYDITNGRITYRIK